jgi:hypothetical protein
MNAGNALPFIKVEVNDRVWPMSTSTGRGNAISVGELVEVNFKFVGNWIVPPV